MSDVRIIVDHLKLEYSGAFDANGFFKMIDHWMTSRGFNLRYNKNFEYDTKEGKQVEADMEPWKFITDTTRHFFKIKVFMFNLQPVEVKSGKKTEKLHQGRVLVYLDAYIDHDWQHTWEEKPMLQFMRTMINKFMLKPYTERFEQRLTHDTYAFYHDMEGFFNLYRHYKVVSKAPYF